VKLDFWRKISIAPGFNPEVKKGYFLKTGHGSSHKKEKKLYGLSAAQAGRNGNTNKRLNNQ
jgi:hypothetical protein